MSTQDVNRAVAKRTGEDVETISRRGFSPLAKLPREHDMAARWLKQQETQS